MNPRIGDKVRISRTVVVDDVGSDHSVGAGDFWYNSDQWEIEVIEPRGPQVGDTIEGEGAYMALPVGAVVRTTNTTYVRTPYGWVDSAGSTWRNDDLLYRRELVFLP